MQQASEQAPSSEQKPSGHHCDCEDIGCCTFQEVKEKSMQEQVIQMTACSHAFHKTCLNIAERIDHPEVPVDTHYARCPRCRVVSQFP